MLKSLKEFNKFTKLLNIFFVNVRKIYLFGIIKLFHFYPSYFRSIYEIQSQNIFS